MKRALRDKWAAALEGGKFTQTDGALRRVDNKCCCLGVLADVFDPDLWDDTDHPDGSDYTINGNSGELPYDVLVDVGLTCEQQNRFVRYNDNEHLTFKEIAAKVRELPVED